MNKIQNSKIFFLGAGKMGAILVKNIVSNFKNYENITILKPSKTNAIKGLKYISSASQIEKNYQADIVFITIKPQGAKAILSEFAKQNIFHKNTIFISILAGKKISFFEEIFGATAKIIRSMPNIAIDFKTGCFTFSSNKNISLKDKENLSQIFRNFGHSFEIKKEDLFSAITAIYGSGPAYIFLLQDIFYKISLDLGIDEDNSKELVKKLFLGSAMMSDNMVSAKNNLHFQDLKNLVTSKKGTTEAAIKVLEEKAALEKLFKSAIKKALKRSQELEIVI
jgi:pyrroline-5-carboxylate reductase